MGLIRIRMYMLIVKASKIRRVEYLHVSIANIEAKFYEDFKENVGRIFCFCSCCILFSQFFSHLPHRAI